MSEVVGRFVGVGIDQYEDERLEPLGYAVAEVEAVAQQLSSHFEGDPLCDATEQRVRQHLRALADGQFGSLMLVWSGHGKASGELLWLHTRDGEILATEVVSRCVASGAGQLLLVIDACHAGVAVADASKVASALLAEYPPGDDRVWFGIVVSCRAGEMARDGAFGALLGKLLIEGPRDADMRRRWSRHNRLIFGDDLGAALIEDWTDEDQRPDFVSRGRRWFMLPNPLWDPGAPEQVVEHLLLAARGGDVDERSWFTGRVAEVDQVVSWVVEGTAGVRVVTGSSGTGKSAIVGRVVSLSNPTQRARLLGELDEGEAWDHADPGERSVHAHIHARGLTVDRAAELLDGQLVRPVTVDGRAVLSPSEVGRRSSAELVGALQRVHQNGSAPPVIVVDGLDEARDEAFRIAEELLGRVAAFATVIVSTRPSVREQAPQSVLEVLAPVALLDLDEPAHQESQRAAMRGYLERRLAGVADAMDPALVADELVANNG